MVTFVFTEEGCQQREPQAKVVDPKTVEGCPMRHEGQDGRPPNPPQINPPPTGTSQRKCFLVNFVEGRVIH